MTKFNHCFMFISVYCSGLWGCSAHKPNPSPTHVEVAIPSTDATKSLPPLPKPEGKSETVFTPSLYFEPFQSETIIKQILTGLETANLPEKGVCIFWNRNLQHGNSRQVFLLEKKGEAAQLYPLSIVIEDLPKLRKTFEERSILVPGKAGHAGWRIVCKPMEPLLSKIREM